MKILDQKFHAEKQSILAKRSLWDQSGPFLLLSAFTILISKCAPFFFPLLLITLVGYTANLIWKKGGFYFSLTILATAWIYTVSSGVDPFWSSLLCISVALSWLLIFLGRQESEAIALSREEKMTILESNQGILERNLREAKISLSEENRENVLERERLSCLYAQALHDLDQAKLSLKVAEKEREKLTERCEILSQDIFSYQRKEIAFQSALDDAQAQLLKSKHQQLAISSNLIPQEETAPQEKIQLEHVQHKYALLRQQFDEKSEALDKARSELFHMENEFLALQNSSREKTFEMPPEEDLQLAKDLKHLEEEYSDLEAQVYELQEFISSLLSPKKRVTRSRKSLENQERLPFLIQEKIDQTISIDSTS